MINSVSDSVLINLLYLQGIGWRFGNFPNKYFYDRYGWENEKKKLYGMKFFKWFAKECGYSTYTHTHKQDGSAMTSGILREESRTYNTHTHYAGQVFHKLPPLSRPWIWAKSSYQYFIEEVPIKSGANLYTLHPSTLNSVRIFSDFFVFFFLFWVQK